MNVAELALKSLDSGEQVSYVFEGKDITNVQMDTAAKRLGNGLKKLGVQKGDRVVIQMPNCPEVLQSFQAIWKIGAIAVPINYQFSQEDVAFIYSDCGARVIISAQNYLDNVRHGVSGLDHKTDIIILSPDEIDGTHNFMALLDEHEPDLDIEPMEDKEVATLIYTSGTTGRPKGVMLSHGSHRYTAEKQQETLGLPQDLISLAVLPLCHSFGIATMNGSFLRLKGKVIIMRQFNLEEIFDSIQKYKVQSLPAVPTMYVYMLLFPDAAKYDISSVQYYFCGSAPLSLKTWQEFKDRFGGDICEGWGLTEAGANNSANPRSLIKVGSIGRPMKGMEMKVVDFGGNELPAGQEGEIIIKGPMLMKGYWNLPVETNEAIKNGWLYTGDIGFVDEDGYFFITDRKKDLIIKGGENISPRVIEEALMKFPKIAEAAVIGIKDDVFGEEIKGFVTLRPEQQATPEEIIEHCRKNLTRFFVPKEIAILDAMPKTIVGKILKKELRKMQ